MVKSEGQTRTAWFFLTPAFVHLLLFAAAPIAFAAWMSLHRWSLLATDHDFVGLRNYTRLLDDGAFWSSLGLTFTFTLLTVPTGIALALLIAAFLDLRLRGMRFLQTAYFLPVILSAVAIALIWQWMFHGEFGLINHALDKLGLGKLPWLQSTTWAMVAIAIVSIWKVLGYQVLILFAGLQGIPEEVHEAARLDGAPPVKRFLRITLPLLKPALFFVLITSVISSFQVFTTVYVMTEGGPAGSTDVVGFHIYELAFADYRMGYAAAQSFVLMGIILMATWFQVRMMSDRYDQVMGA